MANKTAAPAAKAHKSTKKAAKKSTVAKKAAVTVVVEDETTEAGKLAKVGHAIADGASATGRALIDTDLRDMGHGIKDGVEWTGRKTAKGVRATGRGLKSFGSKVAAKVPLSIEVERKAKVAE